MRVRVSADKLCYSRCFSRTRLLTVGLEVWLIKVTHRQTIEAHFPDNLLSRMIPHIQDPAASQPNSHHTMKNATQFRYTHHRILCTQAWPGFESAYDSQVIGLWQFEDAASEVVEYLLLTRRPDLAQWERSKQPQGPEETEVRRKLSQRYDLCDSTVVYTSTLISAKDHRDTHRWA